MITASEQMDKHFVKILIHMIPPPPFGCSGIDPVQGIIQQFAGIDHGANADLAATLVAVSNLAEADLGCLFQRGVVQRQAAEFIVAEQVIDPVRCLAPVPIYTLAQLLLGLALL